MAGRKPNVVLRLALYGCPNRPFFHIVAGKRRAARNRYIYEQVCLRYLTSSLLIKFNI